jgi:Family of unknown function (DUF6165)
MNTRLKPGAYPCVEITIPISPGELLDRLVILEIKSERITDIAKRTNVVTEWSALAPLAADILLENRDIIDLKGQLRAVNETLWEIEDTIREHERRGDFGPGFISLARAVYHTNDQRAAVKRAVNDRLGSTIVEEKSYAKY